MICIHRGLSKVCVHYRGGVHEAPHQKPNQPLLITLILHLEWTWSELGQYLEAPPPVYTSKLWLHRWVQAYYWVGMRMSSANQLPLQRRGVVYSTQGMSSSPAMWDY